MFVCDLSDQQMSERDLDYLYSVLCRVGSVNFVKFSSLAVFSGNAQTGGMTPHSADFLCSIYMFIYLPRCV